MIRLALALLSLPLCADAHRAADDQAAVYPATSYELSADGLTLVKWLGPETDINMQDDAVLRQVTTIGEEAFAFNSTFVSVALPAKVTTIGQGAFNMAMALQDIMLPESLRTIGDKAFRMCRKLTAISLPEGVTSIGSLAFEDCGELTQVSLPSTVSHMGGSAFLDCRALESLYLADGISALGSGAFCYCTKLPSVSIPPSITAIPSYAFAYCTQLKDVTLPATLKEIGEDAFGFAEQLTSVTCLAETPPATETYTWSNCNLSGITLHVPRGSVDAYRAVSPWNQFRQILPIGVSPDELVWCLVTDAGQKVPMSQVSLFVAADDDVNFTVLDTEGNVLLEGVKRASFQQFEATGIKPLHADGAGDNLLKRYASGRLILMGAKDDIDIYSTAGQRVIHAEAQRGETAINVSHLPTATYIVRCGRLAFKFIKK